MPQAERTTAVSAVPSHGQDARGTTPNVPLRECCMAPGEKPPRMNRVRYVPAGSHRRLPRVERSRLISKVLRAPVAQPQGVAQGGGAATGSVGPNSVRPRPSAARPYAACQNVCQNNKQSRDCIAGPAPRSHPIPGARVACGARDRLGRGQLAISRISRASGRVGSCDVPLDGGGRLSGQTAFGRM